MTPQQISRILREGGLPRASGYKVWGRETEGFQVISGNKHYETGDVCTVWFTAHYNAGREMYERAQEILTAAGIEHAPYGRPGVGGSYALRIPKGSV